MPDTRERPAARARAAVAFAPSRARTVPRLPADALDLFGREFSSFTRRATMRQSLTDALLACEEMPEHHKPRIKRSLGRLLRAGKELAAPLEETRHCMLRYFDMIACGYAFLSADPMLRGTVMNEATRELMRFLAEWRKQLESYVDAQGLRMSVSEAMGMPETDDEESQ